MKRQSLKQHRQRIVEKPCTHYWLISPPAGPTSEGKCRECGEVRIFFNSPDVPPEVIEVNGHKQTKMRKMVLRAERA